MLFGLAFPATAVALTPDLPPGQPVGISIVRRLGKDGDFTGQIVYGEAGLTAPLPMADWDGDGALTVVDLLGMRLNLE